MEEDSSPEARLRASPWTLRLNYTERQIAGKGFLSKKEIRRAYRKFLKYLI